jgi:hypothetical protein
MDLRREEAVENKYMGRGMDSGKIQEHLFPL